MPDPMDAPFTLIPPVPGVESRLLFLCDHASNFVPADYDSLGLPAPLFETHIAYDIGAARVTRALAKAYGAAALLGGVSRLLIDLNRGAGDPTLVMKLSDGSIIPGNRDADADEVTRRLERFHAPYHAAIREQIARISSLPRARDSALVEEMSVATSRSSETERGPILISIHSFTPAWKSVPRPWEVGVLYGSDAHLARPLMQQLRAAGFVVGDNEPYAGALEGDTLDIHGTKTGHANVLIEIRQDFLANAMMATAFAARLKPILDAALMEMEDGMDDRMRTELEAAVFRRLVRHFQARTDVQNIDLMTMSGFCRNCLGDWYREAAAEKGIALEKDQARALIYGMAPAEWKKKYQTDATPEQIAAFEASQRVK